MASALARARRSERSWLVGLGIAILLGLTSCSGVESGDSQSEPAGTTTVSPSGDLQPRDDLQGEQPVQWTRYEQLGDREIRVHFLIGDLKCYGARAEVSETSDAVEVTVLQGSVPGAPENCALDAAQASLLVTAEDPIGDRKVTQP